MSGGRKHYETVWFLPVLIGAGTTATVTVSWLASGSDPLPLIPLAVLAGVVIGVVFLRISQKRDRTMDRVAGADSREDSFAMTKQAIRRGPVPADPAERRRALEIVTFWHARQRRYGRIFIPLGIVFSLIGAGFLLVEFSALTAIQTGLTGAVAISWWLQDRQLRRRIQELSAGEDDEGEQGSIALR